MTERPVNKRVLAHSGTVRHTMQGPAKPRTPVRIRTPPPEMGYFYLSIFDCELNPNCCESWLLERKVDRLLIHHVWRIGSEISPLRFYRDVDRGPASPVLDVEVRFICWASICELMAFTSANYLRTIELSFDFYSIRASSSRVMRLRSGSVEAMIAREPTRPPATMR